VRGAIWLVAAAVALAAAPAAAQDTLVELEVNGASDNRIDLLIMGDGYTAAEQDAFLDDADAVIAGLFGESPYAEYRPFFNFYGVQTVSAESGADHPAEGDLVDTAFGCAYDCYDLYYMICCDDGAALTVADALLPSHDAVLLLVNDPEYGGSGGPVAVISMAAEAVTMAMHEFSHSFGGLADEYETPYPAFTFTDIYPNVSPTAELEQLKWAAFVDEATPLPTPEPPDDSSPLAPVGAYEGACYQSTGLYRPVPNCLMRTLAHGPCPVCSQQLVLSYYDFVEIIDASEPAEAEVSGAAGETIEFSVDAVEPVPTTIIYDWVLDGAVVGHEAAFSLPIGCLTPGAHELVAEVRDETALVLEVYDPELLLEGSRSWTATRTDDGEVEECFGETPADTESDAGTDAGPAGKSDDGCGCGTVGGGLPTSALLLALLG
jgi:hypothetical protein